MSESNFIVKKSYYSAHGLNGKNGTTDFPVKTLLGVTFMTLNNLEFFKKPSRNNKLIITQLSQAFNLLININISKFIY